MEQNQDLSFDELDIPDQLKQQVKLVIAKFRRASGRTIATDGAVDPRLAEQLYLTEITVLIQESMALHGMVTANSEDLGESVEKLSRLLKEIEEFVPTAIPFEISALPNCSGQVISVKAPETDSMYDNLCCPLTYALLKDPVTVATGQTYERKPMEKWLETPDTWSNLLGETKRTCPSTQLSLNSNRLIPNLGVQSLIANWSKTRSASACTTEERSMIESHLTKLVSVNDQRTDDQRANDQRDAVAEICLLAKKDDDYRIAIVEAGGIPLLEHLLTAPDSRTQVYAVTALLNLSCCEDNKRIIVQGSAVLRIIQVLSRSTMEEARSNAAATLFSLSIVDQYKERLGFVGAIPPLVKLLSDGSQRGKKDAASALHSLCKCHGNKGRAVRSDIIPTLIMLLAEQSGMQDEALHILDILSSHPEAMVAIGEAKAVVRILVEFIRNGSPSNKDNATGILGLLCSGDEKHLAEARKLEVTSLLLNLIQNGTRRGKRKAGQLLRTLADGARSS